MRIQPFPHNPNIQVGHVMSLLLDVQHKHSITNTIMVDLLDVIRIITPIPSQIPTYRSTQAYVNHINDIKITRFSQCRRSCPVEPFDTNVLCQHGHPRLKESVLALTLKPQLQTILSKYTWDELTTPPTTPDPQNIIYNIYGSRRYRHKMASGDQHQVIPYIICTDGVGVNIAKFHRRHQMWPFFVELLMTPFPHEVALLGIIEGPRHPKNPSSAFGPMKAQLLHLDNTPFAITDRMGVARMCVTRCILQVCDGPGHAKLVGVVHSSSKDGCRFCHHKFDKVSGRMLQHDPRCMLPHDDPLRTDPRWAQPNHQTTAGIKTDTNYFDLWAFAAQALNTGIGFTRDLKHINGVKYAALLKGLKCWNATFDAPLDIMHLVRNLMYHLTQLYTGSEPTVLPIFQPPNQDDDETETKYLHRCQLAYVTFRTSTPYCISARAMTQEPNWLLTQAQRNEIDRRYASFRSHSNTKGTGLPFAKSGSMTVACWYFFVKYCSQWIFNGIFVGDVYKTNYELYGIFRHILRHQHRREWFAEYRLEITRRLCEICLVLPATQQSLWFHYIFHMMDHIETWGPAYHYSMMRFERHVGTLARDGKQRVHPEYNIASRWAMKYRSHQRLYHWRRGVIDILNPYPRLITSLYSTRTVNTNRRMGNRQAYVCMDRRRYRMSGHSRVDAIMFIASNRDLFGVSSLTSNQIRHNTTIDGEYRYASLDGRSLGCSNGERDVDGATRQSCFLTLPDLHHYYRRCPTDQALAGQVHFFFKATIVNPMTNMSYNVDIARVSIYRWHRTQYADVYREYRIDKSLGIYQFPYIPLGLLAHTILLAQDPQSKHGDEFVLSLDMGLDAEVN